MSIYLKIGALLGVVFATWYTTSDHYQKEIVALKLEASTAAQTATILAAARVKTAGEQHAEDQLTINSLNDKLTRVPRVHIPTCGDRPQTSAHSNREAGVLSERVDAAFEKLRAGTTSLVTRCDQLNIDAIQNNNSQ